MKISLPVVQEVKRFKQNHTHALKQLRESPDLDQQMHQEHEQVFAEINCLDCAHCCKTTGPLFTQEDMDRIAALLNMSTGNFIQEYLVMDEDGDFVLQSLPCPFLMDQNECSIYPDRPRACRQYPHTQQTGQSKIFDLTMKNMEVCPAVWQMIQSIV